MKVRKELLDQIDAVVKSHPIVLFMKGTPSFPRCGFSQRVAAILQSYGVPFQAVDVLMDPELREAVKIYSDWPTYPQLYLNGELIGGHDIVVEMHESGELAELLAPFRESETERG